MTLQESLGLDDRVIIVTGGGRGLGKAMSISLAEAGANVVLASRTVSQLEEAASEVRVASGRDAFIVPTDVQSSEQIDRLVAATVEKYGRLDAMINNAGGGGPGSNGTVYDLTDEAWQNTLEINLHSAFYGSRAAANQFKKQGPGGVIINVSSGTALRAFPAGMAYAASKAGVISITKTAAAQLVGQDIRVNCIVPGFVSQAPSADAEVAAQRESRGKFVPVQRLGEAWELGPLAVFLCSDASKYITGETFSIDGGGLGGGIAPTGYAMDAFGGSTNG